MPEGKADAEVGFPDVVHNPRVDRASVVFRFAVAEQDGVLFELASIQKGGVQLQDEQRAFFS